MQKKKGKKQHKNKNKNAENIIKKTFKKKQRI